MNLVQKEDLNLKTLRQEESEVESVDLETLTRLFSVRLEMASRFKLQVSLQCKMCGEVAWLCPVSCTNQARRSELLGIIKEGVEETFAHELEAISKAPLDVVNWDVTAPERESRRSAKKVDKKVKVEGTPSFAAAGDLFGQRDMPVEPVVVQRKSGGPYSGEDHTLRPFTTPINVRGRGNTKRGGGGGVERGGIGRGGIGRGGIGRGGIERGGLGRGGIERGGSRGRGSYDLGSIGRGGRGGRGGVEQGGSRGRGIYYRGSRGGM